jgi:CHAD domain-containing protein
MVSPTTAISEQGRLALDEHLSLKQGLGLAFADVIRYSRSVVEDASVDPVAAVHEFRKALRRGRALVRLSRPLLGDKTYREIVQDLREAFLGTSPLRDATVLLGTLSRLGHQRCTRSARSALRRLLRSEAAAGAGAAAVVALEHSVELIAPLPARFSGCLPPRVHWRQVREAVAKSFRRARRARCLAMEDRKDRDVHAFRKRVKELRYQLELLAAAQGGKARHDYHALAALAEGLGEVTDLTLLRHAVRLRSVKLAPARPRSLVVALDRRIGSLLGGLFDDSARLFSHRPERFAARAVQLDHDAMTRDATAGGIAKRPGRRTADATPARTAHKALVTARRKGPPTFAHAAPSAGRAARSVK